MGLNLSNQQIARALELNKDDVQRLTEQLRQGVVANRPQPVLSGAVEGDAVYVVAGHKGQPEAVKKRVGQGDADGCKAPGDAARWRRRSPRFWG